MTFQKLLFLPFVISLKKYKRLLYRLLSKSTEQKEKYSGKSSDRKSGMKTI